eukprot:TRINITY_DN5597_c0_g2_i1.p2 TRINITY_DN5597_c0_g2~~TRINITY_DN5597_c0_g2_i1.p2  ORF type:complete len:407 (+),score=51.80 TRINITY_DN5597_c0_g2_i1:647-1867(+)
MRNNGQQGNSQRAEQQQQLGYVHREGQHRVYFGVIYVGPDWPSLLITIALVVIPSGVYLGLVAPHLGDRLHWASVGIGSSLILLVLSSLFATAFKNPGIIKRRHMSSEALKSVPKYQHVAVNGQEVMVKFCMTCHLQRPPRCSHCAVCDNCVEKFDHHCPWMGTCIGRRNYRPFLVFVISTTVLCYYVAGTSVALLVDVGLEKDGIAALRHSPAAVILGAFCMVASFFPLGLGFFHLYLLAKNYTTYEHFKSKLQNTNNPYDRGCTYNTYEVCCFQTQAYEYQNDDDEEESKIDLEDQQTQSQSRIEMTVTGMSSKGYLGDEGETGKSQQFPQIDRSVTDVEGGNDAEGGGIELQHSNVDSYNTQQDVIFDQALNTGDELDSQSSGGEFDGQGKEKQSQARALQTF